MYRRAALTTAVSLVTVSAGCLGGDDEQSSDPETTTDNGNEDEDETEEEVTLETFEYPESVDQNGFRRNVANTHEERLAAAESFQLTRESETSAQFTSEASMTISVDEGKLLLQGDDGHLTRSVWTDSVNDGTDVLVRNSNNFGERYMTGEQSQMVEDIDGSDTLGALINASMFEATEINERDDTPVVVFESTDVVDIDALKDVQHMDQYDELEASIVVSEAGIVGYQYELEGNRFDGPAVITESVTFEAVGETTLEKPDWVDSGWDRALDLSMEPAADELSVIVEVEHGEPIPAGSRIGLSAERHIDGQLEQQVTQDDTLYLYDDGGELGISVNSEPNPSSSLDSRFLHLSIHTETGLPVYQGEHDTQTTG